LALFEEDKMNRWDEGNGPGPRTIARELVETIRRNMTIDWSVRESVRAKMRVMVKRILRKYGYPPDKQERATQTVLEQAELLSEGWAV
jgi:type I restriction enzyme R subunit